MVTECAHFNDLWLLTECAHFNDLWLLGVHTLMIYGY